MELHKVIISLFVTAECGPVTCCDVIIESDSVSFEVNLCDNMKPTKADLFLLCL
jgi:hypothetical protein